jgi:GNAT superfamily N-acetyltransferase
MEPRIVPLDPVEADDDLLGRVWDLQRACHLLVAPDEPMRDRAETIAMVRHSPATDRRWHWISGNVDGFVSIVVSPGSTTAWLVDLLVAPEARRRGIGRALLHAAAEQARAAGCKSVVGNHLDPAGPGFVRAVGARESTDRNRRSVLRLPLGMPPVPAVAGYELVSWTGAAPDDLLESYAEARHAINDAPHDDAVAAEHFTAERIRDIEAAVARRDRELRVTVAVDRARTVVGQTEMRVGRTAGATAFTEETAVVAAHRGRGLALWIKDEALRRLAADRPDVPYVVTDNDVTNRAMLAVNDLLGFRPTSVTTGAVLEL